MTIERHFLGWDAPLTRKVCDFLLPPFPRGPLDLEDTLLVVPTRQAGRRLREAMACRCGENAALLSVLAVPPSYFFSPEFDDEAEASGTLSKMAWAEVLLAAGPEVCEGFVTPPPKRDAAWAMQTGALLQGLRQELCDGGFTIDGVMRALGDTLPEPERWRAMARLEALYLARLSELGFRDPFAARIDRASRPHVPEAVRRIVVASVPDPSLLALRALEELAARLPVAILIHAPPEEAARFDAWGRPLPEGPASRPIDIPDEAATLLVAATPADQARLAARRIPQPDASGGSVVAVGVPDREVAPVLLRELAARDITAFDPAETPVSGHPIARLVAAYADLVIEGSCEAAARLLRHAHVAAALRASGACDPVRALAELDAIRISRLPQRLSDMTESLKRPPAGGRQDEFANLRPTVAFLCRGVEAFRGAPSAAEALRGFLREVYANRLVEGGNERDDAFRDVAAATDAVLHEFDGAPAPTGFDKRDMLRIAIERLSEERIRPRRPDAALDLEGWLELPWNAAPLMIVTGMNDGMVPDGRLGDVFLPDSLRTRLGLRNDALRLARDAFLMTTLIESRRHTGGRVLLVVGKTSAAGDPLKPSRLLFRCDDTRLVARAEKLFRPVAAERAACASTVTFRLDPTARDARAEARLQARRLSVTAFRDYLACPFRYYLGRVLEMTSVDDRKDGPDAMDFGLMIHAALEAMTVSGLWRCGDEARLASYLGDRAETWAAERFGAHPSLGVRVALDSARQRLAAAAREQVRLDAEGWEPVAAEQRLEMPWRGFLIRGTIDRVDRHRESGRLRIIDYKTSDVARSAREAHLAPPGAAPPPFARVEENGKARRWIDLQLPLYRRLLAVRDGRDAAPQLAYFNLPRAVADTGLEVWEDFSDALYAAACACAEAVCDGIAGGAFWPPAARVAYDDFENVLFGDPARFVDGSALSGFADRKETP